MKVKCIHGYFIFEELRPGEFSEFMGLYGFNIESKGPYFTFSDLASAPEYSIKGLPYLGAVANKTFAGRPWDVMRENGLVYDFSKGLVVPIRSITAMAEIDQAQNYFVSNGMLIPGSIMDDGTRVTDYAAFYNREMKTFRYSEVILE